MCDEKEWWIEACEESEWDIKEVIKANEKEENFIEIYIDRVVFSWDR